MKKIIGLAVLVALLLSPDASFSQERKVKMLSFTDVPVGYILQSLGRLFGANFSISASAAGRIISVELADVTFDEALEMICSAAVVNIQKAGEGRYIVTTSEESDSGASRAEKELRERENRLVNSFMEVVTTRYTAVADVKSAIESMLGDDYGALCKITRVSNDDSRNYNSLVIHAANRTILDNVRQLIRTIDIPKPMVEIEALFVEVVIGDNMEKGIDWTIMKNPLTFTENAPPQNPKNDPLKFYTLSFGQFWRTSPWEAEAMLDALSGNSRSRVLADPRIRVMSGRKALFASETQVPVFEKNSDGDISTDWKNVGVSLEILPVVMEDGSIHLVAAPRASAITGEKILGDVVAPVIAERRTETEVILQPGETMVIGGLMNDKEIRSLSKVPILGNLPLLGELFRSERTENEKSSVVVLLRPVLIDEKSADDSEQHKHLSDIWKNVQGDRKTQKPSGEQKAPSGNETVSAEEGGKGEKADLPASVDERLIALFEAYSDSAPSNGKSSIPDLPEVSSQGPSSQEPESSSEHPAAGTDVDENGSDWTPPID